MGIDGLPIPLTGEDNSARNLFSLPTSGYFPISQARFNREHRFDQQMA